MKPFLNLSQNITPVDYVDFFSLSIRVFLSSYTTFFLSDFVGSVITVIVKIKEQRKKNDSRNEFLYTDIYWSFYVTSWIVQVRVVRRDTDAV